MEPESEIDNCYGDYRGDECLACHVCIVRDHCCLATIDGLLKVPDDVMYVVTVKNTG